MNMKLTQSEIRKYLTYNQFTGEMFWNKLTPNDFKHTIRPKQFCNAWNTKYANKKAGCKHESSPGYFYEVLRFKQKNYKLHTIAWIYVTGKYPKYQIDHIDCNACNNKFSNLRDIPQPKNMLNTSLRSNNTSTVKGVSWCKERNKWEAYITVDKKKINLGRHTNFDDAVLARFGAEQKYGFLEFDKESTAKQYIEMCDL